MRYHLRVALLPALQPGQRMLLAFGASDFEQGMPGGPAPGWLHTRRLARLLSEMGRPRGIPKTVALMSSRQLEQTGERPHGAVDAFMAITQLIESTRHRGQGEVCRF